MLPVTVIASQAYMLPVATGPNAIIFGTGTMKTSDMVTDGFTYFNNMNQNTIHETRRV